jgi:hypothetical protein
MVRALALGPEFDSSGSEFLRLGLKKTPRCVSPALGLRLLFVTLRLCRCRVGDRKRPVSDGKPRFRDFLGLRE